MHTRSWIALSVCLGLLLALFMLWVPAQASSLRPPGRPLAADGLVLSASPAAWEMHANQTISFSLLLQGSGTFTGAVELQSGDLPDGLQLDFDPNPAPPTSTVSVRLQARRLLPGDYTLEFTGVGQMLSGTLSVPVTATASVPLAVETRIFMPQVFKHWPPVPYQPVLSLIQGADDGNFTLNWSEPPERLAEVYVVQQATDVDFTQNVQTVCNTTQQSCLVSNVSAGLYYYRVRGINFNGLGLWSYPRSATVLLPDIPTLYPINNPEGDGSYTVSWSSSALATTYTLQEDDNPNFSSPTVVFQGGSTNWSTVGRTTGVYYYRVRATGPTGTSNWSVVQFANVLPPGTPTLYPIDNSDGNDNYVVYWSSTSRTTSYTLQEATDSGFSNAVTVYSGAGTSYSAFGKTGGRNYYYRVRAEGPTGVSTWSATQSVYVPPVIAAPNLQPIDNPNNNSSYELSWTAVTNATRYILQQSTSSTFNSPITLYEGPGLSYRALYRTAGTYYYRVAAVTSAGQGPWSSTRSTIVIAALHIASSNIIPAPDGSLRVVGEVHNATSFTINLVQLRADLLNANGGIMATGVAGTMINILQPGDVAPFAITLPNLAGWFNYSVYITQNSTTSQFPYILSTYSVATYYDAQSNYHVYGGVLNQYGSTRTNVKAVVTVYDESYYVIGANSMYTNPSMLAPNGSGTFDVPITAYLGKPNQSIIRSYSLVVVGD